MRFLFLLSVIIFFSTLCSAQSDLLILKKHNRTIQSFYPGKEMNFSTANRFYDAFITSIQNDSIFLVQYDVRQALTRLGVYILDTVAQYHFGINYKDIISFGKTRKSFDWSSSGAALFGGGALLATAGLVTLVITKPKTQYRASPQLIIGAAAVAGIGYLLMGAGKKNMKLGKKYSLDYIKLK